MSIIHYYVSGNTAGGVQNLLGTNVDSIKQKIFLSHPSLTLKTYLLHDVIERYKSSCDLEVFYSSRGNAYVEGVVIRNKSLAVIDSRLDTGVFSDAKRIDIKANLNENDAETAGLLGVMPQVNQLIDQANEQYKAGLKIHDDLEAVYIQEMDFQSANQLIEQFISETVRSIPAKTTPSNVYHRMFGTNTLDGAVNIIPELIAPISKRYILKGRAGTGKSVFMKSVAKACEARGLDYELYHCSFDPSSIDMVLVRNDFCIMDGTPPHEVSPSRASDVVIDLYEQTVTPGTDEKYAQAIAEISQSYKSYMRKGTDLLKQAGTLQSKQETDYLNILTPEKKSDAIESLNTFLF